MTKEEHGIRFFERLGKELPASLLAYKLAMEKKEAENALELAEKTEEVEQQATTINLLQEKIEEVEPAATYYESEAKALRLQLTTVNEIAVDALNKAYTDEEKDKYAPVARRNEIRDRIFIMGDIRDWQSFNEDGQTFKDVYSLVDSMSNGRFYNTWNWGKWAQEMGAKLPAPNGYSWKKLDLAVSNEYYAALTEIAMNIVWHKDDKDRDKVYGIYERKNK